MNMYEMIEKVEWLCNSMAEAMPDGQRLSLLIAAATRIVAGVNIMADRIVELEAAVKPLSDEPVNLLKTDKDFSSAPGHWHTSTHTSTNPWRDIETAPRACVDTLLEVKGNSGYTGHTTFIALAWSQLTGNANEYRWMDVTDDPLMDNGWEPTHWRWPTVGD